MGDVIGESYVMKRGGKMKSDEEVMKNEDDDDDNRLMRKDRFHDFLLLYKLRSVLAIQ